MEIDARATPERAVLEADVCIVGAGPAGLALAAVLLDAGRRLVIVESGGPGAAPGAAAPDEVIMSGTAYPGFRASRARGIGGSAWLWNTPVGAERGAKFAPLDAVDFGPSRAGRLSGWPIEAAALAPAYRLAQTLAGLGRFAYEGIDWADRSHLAVDDDETLRTRVYQFGSGRWITHGLPDRLRADPRATLCHHATAVRLVADGTGSRVTRLEAVTPSGARIDLRAERYVLAGGAVENARLLLASSEGAGGLGVHPAALEWVGRCFMEHPRDWSMTLVPRSAAVLDRLAFYDAHAAAGGTVIGGRLAPGDAALRRDGLPNASITLLPRLAPSALGRLLGREPRTAGYGWSRRRRVAARADAIRLLVNVEQSPHPDNRVTLGGPDAAGVRRAHLHWEWRPEDAAGLERVRALVRRTLEAAGLGRVETVPAPPDPAAHHHAGTTRMASRPDDGVVDPDCRVFGLENLYVSGASVFPVAGYANPTLTILAMAIRLGRHLAG